MLQEPPNERRRRQGAALRLLRGADPVAEGHLLVRSCEDPWVAERDGRVVQATTSFNTCATKAGGEAASATKEINRIDHDDSGSRLGVRMRQRVLISATPTLVPFEVQETRDSSCAAIGSTVKIGCG